MSANHAAMSRRQVTIVVAVLGLLLLPVAWGVQWLAHKHIYLQQSLEEIEPRYARLKGLQEKEQELAQALEAANAIKARVLYPAQGDATQLGNGVQNRLRSAMVKSGLVIASSQVKLQMVGAEPAVEQIQIHMVAEGNLSQIQLAFMGLQEVQPMVWLEELQINVRGNVMNANAKVDPVLSVRMMFVVPRSKEGA